MDCYDSLGESFCTPAAFMPVACVPEIPPQSTKKRSCGASDAPSVFFYNCYGVTPCSVISGWSCYFLVDVLLIQVSKKRVSAEVMNWFQSSITLSATHSLQCRRSMGSLTVNIWCRAVKVVNILPSLQLFIPCRCTICAEETICVTAPSMLWVLSVLMKLEQNVSSGQKAAEHNTTRLMALLIF